MQATCRYPYPCQATCRYPYPCRRRAGVHTVSEDRLHIACIVHSTGYVRMTCISPAPRLLFFFLLRGGDHTLTGEQFSELFVFLCNLFVSWWSSSISKWYLLVLKRNLFFWVSICLGLEFIRSQVNVTPTFYTEKNGFVTATKLGTRNEFFVASTKYFAAATKRFVDRTKHFVVVTNIFCYPYFNKWLCWYNKTFFSVKANRKPDGKSWARKPKITLCRKP